MAEVKAYDVIVVGAGNAALCAALSAQEGGAR
jgi:tricarballylate dehydrogenase